MLNFGVNFIESTFYVKYINIGVNFKQVERDMHDFVPYFYDFNDYINYEDW